MDQLPTILLVCTNRWWGPARLAAALAEVGSRVEVICPLPHPLTTLRSAPRVHRYRALDPVRSIDKAIERAKPDLVIPCDDLATAHLHRVHDGSQKSDQSAHWKRLLIERSLGPAESFPIVTARTRLMMFASECGVRIPKTAVVTSAADVRHWVEEHGAPAILKIDGSSGGRLQLVSAAADAKSGWDALSSPPSPARAIKRILINRDMNYVLPALQRTRPVMNIQQFIVGRDANSTVACWDGHVLACTTAAVLHTMYRHGPAAVVRIIEHKEIASAVRMIVGRLQLSGLYGFDFLLDGQSGEPYLIEMNPRATQICHLRLGKGHDLPAALHAALVGRAVDEAAAITTNSTIAFFPQEWWRDSGSHFLRTAYHDVPWSEPALLRETLKESRRLAFWKAMSSRFV